MPGSFLLRNKKKYSENVLIYHIICGKSRHKDEGGQTKMTTQMNCYYYKWVSRRTGKVILVNFGWTSSFRSIAEKVDPRKISCEDDFDEEE